MYFSSRIISKSEAYTLIGCIFLQFIKETFFYVTVIFV